MECLTDDTAACSKCASGYYINHTSCLSCPYSNCETCNSSGCLSFRPSTKQIAYINSSNVITPALCNQECMDCSTTNPEFCLNCHVGFANKNGLCIPCSYPCKTCAENDETSCLSCYSNAYLSNNKCLTCTNSSNCLTCAENALSSCTTCPYYFLRKGSTCARGCPSFCLECANGTVCSVCEDGYIPNTKGSCVPCISNCRHCSSG